MAGNGRLAVRSLHSGAEAAVTYRRSDGTYDDAALARLRRVLRSRDGGEGPLEPRFVELLGWLYAATGASEPLRIQLGYRSPAYNEALRKGGARAASGSLHTEGMASDVALDRARLEPCVADGLGQDVAVPAGMRGDGLPAGVTLIAPAF